MSGKYVRVYYSIIGDERFVDVYHDAKVLGTWLQLLLVADAMHPADAPLPAYVNRTALKVLIGAGLIEERPHQHFCIHGLASERQVRSESARNAAAFRWNGSRIASRDEHSKDKTSRDEQGAPASFRSIVKDMP